MRISADNFAIVERTGEERERERGSTKRGGVGGGVWSSVTVGGDDWEVSC